MVVGGSLLGGIVAVVMCCAAMTVTVALPRGPVRNGATPIRIFAFVTLVVLMAATVLAAMLDALLEAASSPFGLVAGMIVGMCSLAVAWLWLQYAAPTAEGSTWRGSILPVLGIMVAGGLGLLGVAALGVGTVLSPG